MTAGQPIQLDVDGVHQVLVYRLTDGETYSQALNTMRATLVLYEEISTRPQFGA